MLDLSVYLPLSLNSENARKLYCLSRINRVSLNCIVENIIKEYLETQDIPDIPHDSTKSKTSQLGLRKRVGENIAYLRSINYLSQRRLGELVGLDQRSISLIEVGKRRIDLLEACALADALNVEIKDILN